MLPFSDVLTGCDSGWGESVSCTDFVNELANLPTDFLPTLPFRASQPGNVARLADLLPLLGIFLSRAGVFLPWDFRLVKEVFSFCCSGSVSTVIAWLFLLSVVWMVRPSSLLSDCLVPEASTPSRAHVMSGTGMTSLTAPSRDLVAFSCLISSYSFCLQVLSQMPGSRSCSRGLIFCDILKL